MKAGRIAKTRNSPHPTQQRRTYKANNARAIVDQCHAESEKDPTDNIISTPAARTVTPQE